MSDRRTLLYCSSYRAVKFAYRIALLNKTYSFELIAPNRNPFSYLPDVDGTVFIGNQTSRKKNAIFDSQREYYVFIDQAHDAGMGIAAVLHPRIYLPGMDKGIDRVIRPRKEEMTCEEIAEKLKNYYDSFFTEKLDNEQ